MSDLYGPGSKPQASRTDSDAHRLLLYYILLLPTTYPDSFKLSINTEATLRVFIVVIMSFHVFFELPLAFRNFCV